MIHISKVRGVGRTFALLQDMGLANCHIPTIHVDTNNDFYQTSFKKVSDVIIMADLQSICSLRLYYCGGNNIPMIWLRWV